MTINDFESHERVFKNRLKYDLKSNQIICQKYDLKSQSNPHLKNDLKSKSNQIVSHNGDFSCRFSTFINFYNPKNVGRKKNQKIKWIVMVFTCFYAVY
jgi:hypothetical protein